MWNFNSIEDFENRSDDMQDVLNQMTLDSPFAVDNGWIAEVEAQEVFDNLDPAVFD